MSEKNHYQTHFKLNKAHFAECYDQTVQIPPLLKRYSKALLLCGIGAVLIFTYNSTTYIEYFILALGILDIFAVHYRKTWWLWRQMLSKAANSETTLTLNNLGIHTKSVHVRQIINWSDINQVDKTESGLIIRHNNGVNYLSNQYLTDDARHYIQMHCK